MRKNALPIGILFMVLVVLLAGIGISYGYWTESLQADGVLSSGELDVRWGATNSSFGQLYYGNEVCNVAVDGSNNNLLHITVSNLHPGSTCTLQARVVNEGTVPVEIVGGDANYAYGSTDLDDALEVSDLSCDNPVVALSGYRTCSATLTMDWDADNSTENKTAHYTAELDVVQYNNNLDGDFSQP